MTSQKVFDPDQFDDAMNDQNLIARLEEKYRDRPFREENAWWYHSARIASFVFQIINIASGFARPFAYLSGIFAFGVVGGLFAAAIATFFVVGIEWAARKNLIQLLEKNFFRKRLSVPRIVAQVFLHGGIVALSFWGAADAVKIMSGDVIVSAPVMLDEASIRARYETQIAEAGKSAAAFLQSASWKGKLDPANQRRYNALLAEKSRLTAEMNTALERAANQNRESLAATDAEKARLEAEKAEKDATNGGVLAFIAVLSCLLFTVCIWLKEFYEYRCALELVQEGTIKNRRISDILTGASSAISDREARAAFFRQNGHRHTVENAASTPPRRPIGFFSDPAPFDISDHVDQLAEQPPFAQNVVPPDATLTQEGELLFKQAGGLFKQIVDGAGNPIGLAYRGSRQKNWIVMGQSQVRSTLKIYERRIQKESHQPETVAGLAMWQWAAGLLGVNETAEAEKGAGV